MLKEFVAMNERPFLSTGEKGAFVIFWQARLWKGWEEIFPEFPQFLTLEIELSERNANHVPDARIQHQFFSSDFRLQHFLSGFSMPESRISPSVAGRVSPVEPWEDLANADECLDRSCIVSTDYEFQILETLKFQVSEGWLLSGDLTPCWLGIVQGEGQFLLMEEHKPSRKLGRAVTLLSGRNTLAVEDRGQEKVEIKVIRFGVMFPANHRIQLSTSTSVVATAERISESIISRVLNHVANDRDPHIGESTELLLSLIIHDALRESNLHFLNTPDSDDSSTNSLINHAARLVANDLAHPWTVESLAERMDVARSTLAFKFKEQTGLTPMQYLFEKRMAHANSLLRIGQKQINEIASLVGYRSSSAFSSAFRRWSGMSPRECQDAKSHR